MAVKNGSCEVAGQPTRLQVKSGSLDQRVQRLFHDDSINALVINIFPVLV